MRNTKCLTIANEKGGIAKTTTSLALTSLIAADGKKILAVDLDKQANLTMVLANKMPYEFNGCGIFDFVENFNNENDGDKSKYIHPTHIPNVDIMPSNKSMSHLDEILKTHASVMKKQPYELLSRYLDTVAGDYDLVICDTPPDWDMILKTGLYMANYILIPYEAEEWSRRGVEATIATINAFRREHPATFNGEIIGIVNCKRRKNTLTEFVTAGLANSSTGYLLTKTFIRDSQPVREAPTFSKTVIEHSPRCNASQDYVALYKEIKHRIKYKEDE